ncbi:MAG TPA: MarR family transcriptional regulator [Acidimicrobiia bacterium]
MKTRADTTTDRRTAWRGFQRMAVGLGSRLNQRLVADSGLSLPDYEILTALGSSETGTLRAFELGAEVQWEKSRLSHHLKRMETRGLVSRTVCESDGRGLWVSITDAGRDAWERASIAHDTLLDQLVFSRLDDEQLDQLASISETVIDGLTDTLCD